MMRTSSQIWMAASMAFAMIPGSGVAWAEVDLQLHQVVVHNDAQVDFHPSYSEELDQYPDGWREWICRRTTHFKVCIDVEEVKPTPRYQNTFSYSLYVVSLPSEDEARQIHHFHFLARPLGRFDDQEHLVDFTVTADGISESSRLRIPIHSITSDHALASAVRERPLRLRIGREESTLIDLRNELKDLDLLIGDDLRVTHTRNELWESAPTATLVPPLGQNEQEFRLTPSVVATGKIELRATPVPSEALMASFFPYRRSGSGTAGDSASGIHDRLTIYIPYRTHGGLDRELPVEIPVQLWPSIWALVLSVVLGALVGSVIFLLIRRRRETWSWELTASILIAILSWLIALVLVSFDSEVRILGLELDPYQLVPAALLGALASLGGGRGALLLKRLPGLQNIDGPGAKPVTPPGSGGG